MAGMLPILVFLFVLVPIAELYVIVQVSHVFGVLDTLVLLFAISIAGGWLAKHQGLGVLRRIQDQVAVGRVPTSHLVDGAILLVAGVLMLAPGFITDAVGLLLLLPPTRAVVRRMLMTRFRRTVTLGTTAGRAGRHVWRRVVVDTDSREADAYRRPPEPPKGELE
jgi:UPF0716 protein FxsA